MEKVRMSNSLLDRKLDVGTVKEILISTNKLLRKYDSKKDYLEKPAVEIDAILYEELGITDIREVGPSEIGGNHAVVIKRVLYLDKTRTKEQRLFSKAHEAAHIMRGDIDINVDNTHIAHGTPQNLKEDIADFIAANLVLPLDRFDLWEAKNDSEIAEAFGVEKTCVRKRRQEFIDTVNLLQ
jgi:Zn-dependent peptidase ImmA (M78 family)